MGSYFGYAVAATDINNDGWVREATCDTDKNKKEREGAEVGKDMERQKVKCEVIGSEVNSRTVRNFPTHLSTHNLTLMCHENFPLITYFVLWLCIHPNWWFHFSWPSRNTLWELFFALLFLALHKTMCHHLEVILKNRPWSNLDCIWFENPKQCYTLCSHFMLLLFFIYFISESQGQTQLLVTL